MLLRKAVKAEGRLGNETPSQWAEKMKFPRKCQFGNAMKILHLHRSSPKNAQNDCRFERKKKFEDFTTHKLYSNAQHTYAEEKNIKKTLSQWWKYLNNTCLAPLKQNWNVHRTTFSFHIFIWSKSDHRTIYFVFKSHLFEAF